jgi:hypothetical protein
VAAAQALRDRRQRAQPLGIFPEARAGESHHGVQVGERAVRILGTRRPGGGELAPASARVDAGELQAPQKRGGVDQLGKRGPAADVPVVHAGSLPARRHRPISAASRIVAGL